MNENMPKRQLYYKIIANLLFTAAVFVLFFIVLPKLLVFFMPFFIAWIIACIANPLVSFLEKRIKIMRKHGSVIIIVLVLALLVGLIYLIALLLIREARDLMQNLPEIYDNIKLQLDSSLSSLQDKIKILPLGLQDTTGNLQSSSSKILENAIQNFSRNPWDKASNLAKNVAETFLMIIVTIIASYFFIADKDRLGKKIKKITPKSVREHYKLIVDHFLRAFASYCIAQLKLMVVTFFLLFISFLAIHTNYAALLALVTAFIDLLPIFGTGFILWPWILFKLLTGKYGTAIFLLATYILCQTVKQLLQPKLVGDGIGMKPLPTLVFMFIGYRIKGLLGLILGIPVGMILMSFYQSGVFDSQIAGIKLLIHDWNEYRKYKL